MGERLAIRRQQVEADEARRSRPGEVYRLGRHSVACGDSSERGLVGELSKGVPQLLVVTDPPFSSGARQEAAKRRSSSVGRIEGTQEGETVLHRDNLTTVGYQTLMQFVLTLLRDKVREAYVFTDWRMWSATEGVLEALGLPVVSQVVWDKLSPGLGKGWRKRHELIAHAQRDDAEDLAFEAGRPGCFGDVIGIKRDRTWSKHHPTVKPVRLIRKLIANTNAPVVYDPFAGSGSTLIAAELEGRTCLAVELDPVYCDLIRQRWAAFEERRKESE